MSRLGSDAAVRRGGSAALWFAVFGGPAAWFVSLVASYFSVHDVCRHDSALAPRLVSVVTLLVAIAAAVVGRSIWTRNDSSERTRFLAQIGVLGGTVFSLIIFLHVLATLILHPCDERPRTNDSPDVILPGRAPSAWT